MNVAILPITLLTMTHENASSILSASWLHEVQLSWMPGVKTFNSWLIHLRLDMFHVAPKCVVEDRAVHPRLGSCAGFQQVDLLTPPAP